MVHPQTGYRLQEVQDLLALPEPENHPRGGADLHRSGGEPHQVGGDPLEFHHQHSDDGRPLGDLLGDTEQLLHRQAVGRLVVQRREVVGPGEEGDRLRPGAELAALLDPGMQVTDHDPGLDDRLALDLQDKAQHPVSGWMLRTHVDGEPLGVVLTAAEHLLPVTASDRVNPPVCRFGEAGLIGGRGRISRGHIGRNVSGNIVDRRSRERAGPTGPTGPAGRAGRLGGVGGHNEPRW